jgi:hypothetical protein
MSMKIQMTICMLMICGLALLSGCQSTQALTPGAAGTLENLTVVTLETSGTPPALNPPPVGAPVRPNASLMQVEILTLAPSEKSQEYMVAHVLVIASAAIEGFDQYNPELSGQEIDILLTTGEAADLAPGDILDLAVSYRGDEWGGGYYGTTSSIVR